MRAVRKNNWFVVLLPFLIAVSGCQTFQQLNAPGNGKGKNGISLKDAPARKRQPATLDELIDDEFVGPSFPVSSRQPRNNRNETGKDGPSLESAGLSTPAVHVEADLAPDDFDPSRARQLPDLLESARSSGTRPPVPVLKDSPGDADDNLPQEVAFDGANALSGTKGDAAEMQGNGAGEAGLQETNVPKVDPLTATSLDINPFADKGSQTAAPPPPKSPAIPANTAATRNKTAQENDVPVIRLQAKTNDKGASAVLSDEINLLLGDEAVQHQLGDSEGEGSPDSSSDPNLSTAVALENAEPPVYSIGDSSDNKTPDSIARATRIPASTSGASFNRVASANSLDLIQQSPVGDEFVDRAVSAGEMIPWQGELAEAIELLQARFQSGETAPAEQELIRLQLMKIVSGGDVDSGSALRSLPASRREFWQSQLAAIEVLLNGIDDEKDLPEDARQRRRATLAVERLESAATQLSSGAELRVDNATFCNQVRGFGQFTAVPTTFYPKQQILIYCEINNYALQEVPGQGGAPDTVVADICGQYSILDENNRVVGQHQYQPVRDSARWRRKDFYMYFPVALPELPPGNYRLHLSLEDRIGHKKAAVYPELGFSIVARGAAPPRSGPANRTATDNPAVPVR